MKELRLAILVVYSEEEALRWISRVVRMLVRYVQMQMPTSMESIVTQQSVAVVGFCVPYPAATPPQQPGHSRACQPAQGWARLDQLPTSLCAGQACTASCAHLR